MDTESISLEKLKEGDCILLTNGDIGTVLNVYRMEGVWMVMLVPDVPHPFLAFEDDETVTKIINPDNPFQGQPGASTEEILNKVCDFFVESRDFNGISIRSLSNITKTSHAETLIKLAILIEEGQVVCAFESDFPNPHILAFDPDKPDAQIQKLQDESDTLICIYPTRKSLSSRFDSERFRDEPFKSRLLMAEPQLHLEFFDLSVLENYFNDPRFDFDFQDYVGSLHLTDEYQDSTIIPDRHKAFLKAFGLGQNSNGERVAVAFLRDLSDLTPQHQQIWNAQRVDEPCTASQEFILISLGNFLDYGSIYEALIQELVILNKMCAAMGLEPLFRRTFEDKRPREFTPFLRPTLANWNAFIHVLDKMLSENINHGFFSNEDRLETVVNADGTKESRRRGSLAMLEHWLRDNVILPPGDTALETIFITLKKVRKLRQIPAHSPEPNRYDIKYYQKQNELLYAVYTAVRTVRLLFANHSSAKKIDVPDWLYRGDIRIP